MVETAGLVIESDLNGLCGFNSFESLLLLSRKSLPDAVAHRFTASDVCLEIGNQVVARDSVLLLRETFSSTRNRIADAGAAIHLDDRPSAGERPAIMLSTLLPPSKIQPPAISLRPLASTNRIERELVKDMR